MAPPAEGADWRGDNNISPVFAVLQARLVHPAQLLHKTVVVVAFAYGLTFSLFYAAGGSAIGIAIRGS